MAVVATGLLSLICCGGYLWLARRYSLTAAPTARGSHTVPTPHGGGLPLLLAFAGGLALYAAVDTGWDVSYLLFAAAALILMLIGAVDDLWTVSVRLRLCSYGLLCVATTAWLLHIAVITAGWLYWLLFAAGAVAMLWFINLYNFMDGIDGIAGLQAVLALCAAALLIALAGGDRNYLYFCLLLAAAQSGFLVWNWPPARLFMGDAGSVPTGYLLAALAGFGAVSGQLSLLCWLILLAPFITDTSWTLLERLAGGQHITQPHRDHAYQRLSRHWRSHRTVDLLLLAIMSGWLLPLALMAQHRPAEAIISVILAYLPLVLGMVLCRRLA